MKLYRIAVGCMALAFACGAAPNPAQTPPAAGQQAQPDRVSPLPKPDGGGLPTLAPLIQSVRPTVVGVTTTVEASATEAGGEGVPPDLDEFWRRFFGGQPSPFHDGPRGPSVGVGSGVIIDPSGIVLTNNHVVEGAEEVRVKTADETEYTAEVLGTDPETDVAVIRLKGVKGQLQAAHFGNSDAIRVGDFVVAIGNPFGLELTVTTGIISAKARVIGAGPYDDFLQTDAAINPGNSGGPLFDLNGNVIGINTAIVATGSGIGFAVPIDLVKALLPQLREKGRVVRGYLGVGIQDLTAELAQALKLPTKKGALVAQVRPDAPAKQLQPGDVVVSLDGQPVASASELTRRVAQLAPGTKIRLGVLRGGKQQTIDVKLGERPTEPLARQGGGKQGTEQEGALGLQIQPIPPELQQELGVTSGVLVSAVQTGSRADKAGIQPGDVIVEADRKPVKKPADLIQIAKKVGKDPLLLRVVRGEAAVFVVVPP